MRAFARVGIPFALYRHDDAEGCSEALDLPAESASEHATRAYAPSIRGVVSLSLQPSQKEFGPNLSFLLIAHEGLPLQKWAITFFSGCLVASLFPLEVHVAAPPQHGPFFLGSAAEGHTRGRVFHTPLARNLYCRIGLRESWMHFTFLKGHWRGRQLPLRFQNRIRQADQCCFLFGEPPWRGGS